MSKMTFKRISLAVVAALGFGVLSVAPSSAAFSDPTLTLSGQSATAVNLNESVTVTIDAAWNAAVTPESMTIVVTKTGTATFDATKLIPLATDSQNVTGLGSTASNAINFAYTEIDALLPGGTNPGDHVAASAGATYTRAKWTLRLSKASAAGTNTYTVSMRSGATGYVLEKAASFTVTVNAPDTTATAAKSLVYLNQGVTTSNVAIRNNGLGYLAADSSLVVNAGSALTPGTTAVGYLFFEPRNAADSTTAVDGTSAVTGSITYSITGPGLLNKTGGTAGKTIVSTSWNDTVTVYSDGTAGVATITAYLNGTTALTQAAKTITFVGIADSFVATVDSATTGVLRGNTTTVSFDALDSAGNKIPASPVYRTGTPAGYWLVVGDTTVVGPAFTSSDRAAGATTSYSSACAYDSVRAKWVCQVPTTDSGTVSTVYVADSYTATTAVRKSAAITITVSGAGYTGTVTSNKSAYSVGEEALFTLTCKDYKGNNIINGSGAACWSGVRWDGVAAATTNRGDAAAAGGSTNDLSSYITSGGTFVTGVDTVLTYMPTVAGTYKLVGKTSGATVDSTLLTFTVTDPVQDAQTAAIAAAQKAAVAQAAAAQAAADAATDAALQAIDAANAATDAANLAAEAADAATVAAQEAKDAADAATAAVESLATQVATLMAALQAQITSLANVVAKIAKKVKA